MLRCRQIEKMAFGSVERSPDGVKTPGGWGQLDEFVHDFSVLINDKRIGHSRIDFVQVNFRFYIGQ